MFRSEMKCKTCIFMDGSLCMLGPKAIFISNPVENWCGQGSWRKWNDQYQEWQLWHFGEWIDVPTPLTD